MKPSKPVGSANELSKAGKHTLVKIVDVNTGRCKAEAFQKMNTRGHLLLPNARDAASARVFEEAGFAAIGTTSAGIAYGRGLCDGERIGREAMMREIAVIAASVDVSVTADIEAGYGTAPPDIAETIRQVIEAGAVGVNLEAVHTGGGGPHSSTASCRESGLERRGAEQQGIALTINARTDVFLRGLVIMTKERVALTIERGLAYLDAGADLVFVPLLVSPPAIRRLADAFGGRLSLMAMPGAPTARHLLRCRSDALALDRQRCLQDSDNSAALRKNCAQPAPGPGLRRIFSVSAKPKRYSKDIVHQ